MVGKTLFRKEICSQIHGGEKKCGKVVDRAMMDHVVVPRNVAGRLMDVRAFLWGK